MITERKYIQNHQSREAETILVNEPSEILFFLFWQVSRLYYNSCFFLFDGEFAVTC